jgi:PqqD family protein of HPr-rel-A system
MSAAPVPRDGICGVEIDGELVLLDTSSGALHLLNRTAAAVWSELDGKRDIQTIVSELSSAAGVDPDRVRADVIELLGQLRRSDLLD